MINSIGKRRFSIFIAGIGMLRYGNCEPESDDWRDVICENGEYFLIHLSPVSKIEIGRYNLNPDTLISEGFYDSEHSKFVPVKDFVWK